MAPTSETVGKQKARQIGNVKCFNRVATLKERVKNTLLLYTLPKNCDSSETDFFCNKMIAFELPVEIEIC